MKYNIYYCLVAVLSAVFVAPVFAETIVVVGHPTVSIKEISYADLKRLFLAKSDEVQGVKLEPIVQSTLQPIRIVFDEDALGKDPSKSKAYWSRLIFTAAGIPPRTFKSTVEVMQWISAHPNAIGYIESSAVNETVKVLIEL
ncbi:MAG: hypothetical protein KUG82_22075 [Pseudomonadales bacterium]|nr:hypothetical protein [Pseudomonadales bacterium]